ncbi:MAG: GAF domain-containing protein [Deltaproteobacteria bacterium]|nr:GAF domain-containing protein [Deltaproteobacteria bacterium]
MVAFTKKQKPTIIAVTDHSRLHHAVNRPKVSSSLNTIMHSNNVNDIGKILVIGDTSFAQETTEIANNLNASVIAVTDLRHALKYLRIITIELCLVDIDFLQADAVTVIDTLTQKEPETVVVSVATTNSLKRAVATLRAGAFDILQRPLIETELVDILNQTSKYRYHQYIGKLCSAIHDVFSAEREHLPEFIVKNAAFVMNADEASLLLPDGEGRLYVAHSTNPHAIQTAGQSIPMDSCVAGRIATKRTPVVLNGGLNGDLRFNNIPQANRPLSSIVYPLFRGVSLVGVLTLNRRPAHRPFIQRDLDRADLLAHQVAIALDNLRRIHTMAGASRLGAVGQLAAGMVHEINNPLSCILANLELVRYELDHINNDNEDNNYQSDKNTLENIKQMIASAENGASRIMEIARDVRLISRSEKTDSSVFDLGDAVRSALRIAGAQMRCTAAIELDLAPNLSISANPGQIAEVVLHLLMNAEEAMRAPTCTKRELKIKAQRNDNQVLLHIIDTGPGILPTSLSRVFEPFFTTKANDGHTGLGLSICREIIQQHNGALHVTSNSDNGTEFTIMLPFISSSEP